MCVNHRKGWSNLHIFKAALVFLTRAEVFLQRLGAKRIITPRGVPKPRPEEGLGVGRKGTGHAPKLKSEPGAMSFLVTGSAGDGSAGLCGDPSAGRLPCSGQSLRDRAQGLRRHGDRGLIRQRQRAPNLARVL